MSDPQADAIQADIERLADAFAFDQPGKGGPIGKGALEVVSGRIQARNRRQEAPGGSDWAANKAWALKNKLKRGKTVGVLSDPNPESMLSSVQIQGVPTITASTASMVYGVSDFARRKAQWFTNGSTAGDDGTEPSGAKNQEPRPFYSLDDTDRAALDAYFVTVFDAVMGR